MCGKEKSSAQFYSVITDKKNWRDSYCKNCRSIHQRIRLYGVTPKELRRLKKEQDYKCAICKEDLKKKFTVDHCHNNKFVRGILCYNCNTGLGKFKDDVEIINKALLYILKSENKYYKELLYYLVNGNEKETSKSISR